MSAAAFFQAARAYKREIAGSQAGLTDEDVAVLNAATVGRWKAAEASPDDAGAPKPPFALQDAAAFFKSVRAAFGGLEQQQVEGFNALLGAMGKARWPIAWAAYGLATAWHETARTMQPVEEAFWKDDAWRKRNLRYYPWHGRGYPQLTWERNYRWADEELGLNGALIADPTMMLRPEIAALTMIRGMEQGAFTGKGLKDYLPLSGRAGHDAYKAARRIINGQDKAAEIAKIALVFEAALEAGGWA